MYPRDGPVSRYDAQTALGGATWYPVGVTPHESPHDDPRPMSPACRSCKKSIERMKCEYIDLYQVHWPTRDCPLMSTPTFQPGDVNRFMPSFDKGTQADFDVGRWTEHPHSGLRVYDLRLRV